MCACITAEMNQVLSVLRVVPHSPCLPVVTIYLLLRYFLILTTDFYQVFAHLNENIISRTFLPLDTVFPETCDHGYDNFIARRPPYLATNFTVIFMSLPKRRIPKNQNHSLIIAFEITYFRSITYVMKISLQ